MSLASACGVACRVGPVLLHAAPLVTPTRHDHWLYTTAGRQPTVSDMALLTRCPACAQWFGAEELVRGDDAAPGTPPDRCPVDAAAVAVPDERPEVPPPSTPADFVGLAVGLAWAVSSVSWLVIGLPLLVVAAIATWVTGHWLFLIAWAVVTVLAVAFFAALGGVGGRSGPPVPDPAEVEA
jgi:hypothetical protein